jgi:CBS domain-containing protein
MGMNDPISPAVKGDFPVIGLKDSLRSAIEKMSENNTSALIVKHEQEVVGIVTDMDLMHGIVSYDDFDEPTAASFMTPCELITEKFTTSPCIQLSEGESVKNALAVMDTAGVHNLLVDCEMGHGTCMVSIRDLLKLAIEE